MKKLLEVREYDKISCNPDFKNEYAYLPEQAFDSLKEFIQTFAGDNEHADALDFFKISFRRHVGELISVNNYVGLIQIKNGYQIQVLPKIDFIANPDGDNSETKRIFIKMLHSIKEFPNKVFNDANLKIDTMTLYEIFINIYLRGVRILVKHGIKSDYIACEKNLNFYKGKLLVNEQIKRNVAHAERFFVRYDEYLVDRAENKIVKATLLKLQKLSGSAENQKEIGKLLMAFEMVKPSINYQKDFAQVKTNRNVKDYDMLIRWSKVFLFNKSFTTFSGTQNARALLFPMEKLFESYVEQQLRKVLIDLEWDISAQDNGYYLFDSPRKFALRPDIVITRKNGTKIILDTKWKRLINNPKKNYGISQSDMYQMYAYSKKYNTPEIWLLYPINKEMRGLNNLSFNSDDGVNVKIFFVDIADIDTSLINLRDMLLK